MKNSDKLLEIHQAICNAYPDINEKLRKHSLTHSERRILLLLKYDLDNKQISDLLDVKASSLRSMKSKIRKKVNADTLETFVNQL